MANELTKFSLNRGQNEYDVTEAAANTSHSASKDVEITVIRASGLTRQQVIEAVDNIKNALLRTSWPSV